MHVNLLMLAAGRGSRFKDSDKYTLPKPAILINNKSMIQHAFDNISNLLDGIDFDPAIVYSSEHIEVLEPIFDQMIKVTPLLSGRLVQQTGYLNGPADSSLHATTLIDRDSSLLIVNCDQTIEGDVVSELAKVINLESDGAIFVFESDEDRYSYVLVDDDGFVSEMREKEVISGKASCGLIFWKNAGEFFDYAEKLKREKTSGERYISDVCQLAIQDGKKFTAPLLEKFTDLGTPEDLERIGE